MLMAFKMKIYKLTMALRKFNDIGMGCVYLFCSKWKHSLYAMKVYVGKK